MKKVFDKSLIKTQRQVAQMPKDPIGQDIYEEASLAHLARNLVEPNAIEANSIRTTKNGLPIPDDMDISRMLHSAAGAVRDARNILKSSPELCMGIDIYIAGLLSPNDVSAPDLNITSNLTGELSNIKSKLVDVIRTWVKEEYGIDGRLKEWVFKAKYLQGALPIAIIPQTEIDTIINQKDPAKKKAALESYDTDVRQSTNRYNSTGILGPGLNSGEKNKNERNSIFNILKVAQESGQGTPGVAFANTPALSAEQSKAIGETLKNPKLTEMVNTALSNVQIHDNIETLKMPLINNAIAKRMLKKRYSSIYNLALEDGDEDDKVEDVNVKKIGVNEAGDLVYPERRYDINEIVAIRPKDIYDNVGHPIIHEFPYSSVFPISPPGVPEQHLCYLVAVDSTGNALSIDEFNDGPGFGADDATMQTSSGILGTQVLTQAGDNAVDGMTNLRTNAMLSSSARIFNSFITADIKERLKNGMIGGVELDIKFTEMFMNQMFRRALSGQQVQFLVIPSELLTYVAFEYNELGLGESKLIKHRDIAIIASTVQVANALTAINNSIVHKKATITFDEDILDAMDTDEKLKQYIVRSQWSGALFTSTNTSDQLNHVLNSGWHFAYDGGNGAFPDTSFDIEYLNRDTNEIDNEYLNMINKRLIMLSGVSPEIVDMSQEVEFAQSYITGHMLRAQQAALEQQVLCKNITKFIRSFCSHSNIIVKELYNIIKEATGASGSVRSTRDIRELIEEFIESIETSLPTPDTTKLEAQKDNLGVHEEYIDKVIEYFINDPYFDSSEVGEKFGEKLDLIKGVWKSAYMRDILQKNNLVPPQFQALYGNLDSESFIDPFIDAESIVKNMSSLLVQHESQISKLRHRNDAIATRLDEAAQNQFGGDGNNG